MALAIWTIPVARFVTGHSQQKFPQHSIPLNKLGLEYYIFNLFIGLSAGQPLVSSQCLNKTLLYSIVYPLKTQAFFCNNA